MKAIMKSAPVVTPCPGSSSEERAKISKRPTTKNLMNSGEVEGILAWYGQASEVEFTPVGGGGEG